MSRKPCNLYSNSDIMCKLRNASQRIVIQ